MSRVDDLKQLYASAMHGVQSGVAMIMNIDGGNLGDGETSPKHLRTGINSAMVDTAAIIAVLVKKGICTEEEMLTELVASANHEREKYEAELSEFLGKPVKLA